MMVRTHLAQNQFITNSVAQPPNSDAADTAGVTPQPPVAPAGTISNSALASAMTADTAAGPGLTDPSVPAAVLIDEPSSNEGRPSEAPAPRCTEPHDGAGVLADRIDWHEFFQAVMDERVVLFELYDEVPLFIRDGAHLRRWEA